MNSSTELNSSNSDAVFSYQLQSFFIKIGGDAINNAFNIKIPLIIYVEAVFPQCGNYSTHKPTQREMENASSVTHAHFIIISDAFNIPGFSFEDILWGILNLSILLCPGFLAQTKLS